MIQLLAFLGYVIVPVLVSRIFLQRRYIHVYLVLALYVLSPIVLHPLLKSEY